MKYNILIGITACSFAMTVVSPPVARAFQAAPKQAPSKAVAAKPSPMDDVIAMVKGGLSESLIIKTLQQQNKPESLTPAQMVKLKQEGVSENIIAVMIDPKANPAPATAAVTPAVAAGAGLALGSIITDRESKPL